MDTVEVMESVGVELGVILGVPVSVALTDRILEMEGGLGVAVAEGLKDSVREWNVRVTDDSVGVLVRGLGVLRPEEVWVGV